jgi:hypothetical protein
MPDKIAEMISEARLPSAAHLAGAITPIMSPKDFAGLMKGAPALMEAVVKTNPRATQELLRAENPKAVLECSGGSPANTWQS